MNRKYLSAMIAFVMAAMLGVVLTSCDDEDDDGLGISDHEVAAILQGTWDVVYYDSKEAQTYNEVWTFNGNVITAWGTGTFTVEQGRIVSKEALDGYWIVLTRLTENSFEGYWGAVKDEIYIGTKRR